VKKIKKLIINSLLGAAVFSSLGTTAMAQNESLVDIFEGEYLKSTSLVTMPSSGTIHLEVRNGLVSLYDTYTAGYKKRINYWLKDTNGNLWTQGTVWGSMASEYKPYVQYGKDVPAGEYRLYLECPEPLYEVRCFGWGELRNY
jgi:hypothetical protein